MKTVYIAGAMNANNILGVCKNISKGIKLGGEVAKLGFAPFVPHFDVMFAMNGIELPMEFYYNYSMEFMTRCDYVIVCEGSENSVGTKREIEKAKVLGIPVFDNIEALKLYDKV